MECYQGGSPRASQGRGRTRNHGETPSQRAGRQWYWNVPKVSGETRMQQLVNLLIMEGDDDPVLVMRAISSHLQLLKDKVGCYQQIKLIGITGEEPKDYILSN